MAEAVLAPNGWERAFMAAERVKERLHRATKALETAGVPYVVVGGNAVAEWVGRADAGAVRNTRDVDLLVHRSDLSAVRAALEAAGFQYYQLLDVDMFIDGPQGRPSEGIHLLFGDEKLRVDDPYPLPGLDDSERAAGFQVAALEALVRMKLIAYRRKDQVHLLDLIAVGLLDASWPARLPALLGERLQQLLDDPNG